MRTDRTGGGRWRAGAVVLAAVAVVLGAAVPALGIVRGEEVGDGSYPWMVALQSPDGEQFCGGSVLSAREVLTAAHCVAGERPKDVQVAAGAVRLGDPAAQVRSVASFRVPSDGDLHDIAVLVLAEPFVLGDAVRAIAVADPKVDADALDDGSPAVVAGWGVTSESGQDSSSVLRATTLTIVGDAPCDERYDAGVVDDLVVCANDAGGSDSCYGDSGGPLVVRGASGAWVQLGVVSFGVDACGTSVGVYTEVPSYRDWLAGGKVPAVDEDWDGWEDDGWEDEGWEDDDWDDEDWDDEDWDDEDWDDWDDDWSDWGDEDWGDEDWDAAWEESERGWLALELAEECLLDGGGMDCLLDAVDVVEEGW